MRVWTRTEYIWDEQLQQYVVDLANSKSIEYTGPVAECKKNTKVPPPDPNIGIAAREQIELGREQARLGNEWMAFSKQQFAESEKRQSAMDALTKQVVDQQIATQNKANERSDEQWNRYKTEYQPIEDKLRKEALDYASPEKQAADAAAAKADVANAIAMQKGTQLRSAAAMGIDPRSGRYAAADRATDLDAALASAGAENTAREQTKATGRAMLSDSLNVGRGAQSNTLALSGLGLNAGNMATGNQAQANAGWMGNNSIMNQGFSGNMQGNSAAIQGLGAGAQTFLNLNSNQLQAAKLKQEQQASTMAGIGQLAGAAATAF